MHLPSLLKRRAARVAVAFALVIAAILGSNAMAYANSPAGTGGERPIPVEPDGGIGGEQPIPVEPDGGIGGEVVLPVEPDGGIGN